MAKSPKVNKSQAVREYLKAHPGAKPKDIAEALTKAGTKITPGHVANIKSKSRKRRRARKQAATTVGARRGMSLVEIKAALAFVKAAGSIAAAKEALAAVEEIKSMI